MLNKIFCTEKANRRFINLVQYLSNNNKYYSNFISQLHYDTDFSSIYSYLPYISKNDIKLAGTDYFSNEKYNVIFEYTSGSTGIPLKCYKSIEERQILSYYIWNYRRKIDKEVSPKNFLVLLGKNDKKYNFTDLSYENIISILYYIKESGARWLCLSPTMAYYYAIANKKEAINYNNLKYIELQGEYVEQKDRIFIEEAFNCKTILQYGLRETWTIAYECPHGHLRILSDLYQIELKNIESNGFGEIVLSSNVNRYMPILKYKTGDIAKVKNEFSCDCAEKDSFTIELKEGRRASCIKGHENLIADIVFKRIIRKALKPYNYDDTIIKAFSVLQISYNEFVYIIVPGQNYDLIIEKFIFYNTQKIIDKNVNVRFKYEVF